MASRRAASRVTPAAQVTKANAAAVGLASDSSLATVGSAPASEAVRVGAVQANGIADAEPKRRRAPRRQASEWAAAKAAADLADLEEGEKSGSAEPAAAVPAPKRRRRVAAAKSGPPPTQLEQQQQQGASGADPAPARRGSRKRARNQNALLAQEDVKAEESDHSMTTVGALSQQSSQVSSADEQVVTEKRAKSGPKPGTKAFERAEAKAAKEAEQQAFEDSFAHMTEREIALVAFKGKPEVLSQAKKRKAARDEEKRLKVKEEAGIIEGEAAEEGTTAMTAADGTVEVKAKVKKPRMPKANNRLTVRLLAAARHALAHPETVKLPPRPVPNLGYACLNHTLQQQKPMVTPNRGMVLKTIEAKGPAAAGELALANCRDLLPIIQFNYEQNIRLFRLSSDLFPWGDAGKYRVQDLPQWEDIKQALAEAGALARLYDIRLTSHPSEFVKMASQKPEAIESSIRDLELHSLTFDLLGYKPSMYNKINIHVGGTYDGKEPTIERFAENFKRLSENCRKRLAIENDDKGAMFSVADLLTLNALTGIPITFDWHHHKFCTGGFSAKEAFRRAIATWPEGIRPVCHWSESPEDPQKPRHAHSKFIQGPMDLHGEEANIDVMVEAKAKEHTVLEFRKFAGLKVELPKVEVPEVKVTMQAVDA